MDKSHNELKITGSASYLESFFSNIIATRPPLFQTCIVNPVSGVLAVGQSLTGQASGALAGNLYSITLLGGSTSGSVSINQNTGTFIVSASKVGGPVSFSVSIAAGGGFPVSNSVDASFTITEAQVLDPYLPKKKLTVTQKNDQTTDLTVEYFDSVTGVSIGKQVIKPGETSTIELTKNGNNPVTPKYTLAAGGTANVGMTDGSIQTATFAPGTTFNGDSIPDSDFSGSNTVYQKPKTLNPQLPSSAITGTTPQTPGQTTSTLKTVTNGDASKIAFSSAPAAEGVAVTDTTAREGLGAVVDELQKLNVKADEANDSDKKAETAAARAMSKSSQLAQAAINAATAGYMGADGKLAEATATSKSDFQGAVPVVGAASNFTVPSVDDLALGANLPMPDGGSFELKPFKLFPWFKTALLSLREVFLWGMTFLFYRVCQNKLENIQFALSIVPQSTTVTEAITIAGTTVTGSSTALSLFKQVITAGIVTGVIHIELAIAILALNSRAAEVVGTRWNWSNIGNITHTVSSMNPDFSKAFAIIDTSVPINAGVMFMIAYFVFSFGCMISYGVASATIKATRI
jgi:hypothetical protein